MQGDAEPETALVEASTFREQAWTRALLRASLEQDHLECPAVKSWTLIIVMWGIAMAGASSSRRQNSEEDKSEEEDQGCVAMKLPLRHPVQVSWHTIDFFFGGGIFMCDSIGLNTLKPKSSVAFERCVGRTLPIYA